MFKTLRLLGWPVDHVLTQDMAGTGRDLGPQAFVRWCVPGGVRWLVFGGVLEFLRRHWCFAPFRASWGLGRKSNPTLPGVQVRSSADDAAKKAPGGSRRKPEGEPFCL